MERSPQWSLVYAFDEGVVPLAEGELRSGMTVPEMSSEVIQEGFRDQLLYNHSLVRWDNFDKLLFNLNRAMNRFGSYYFVWAGFTNGAFLGVYDKNVVRGSVPTFNTISWMPSASHSCQYNVTKASWESALDTEGSGLSRIPWPYGNKSSATEIPRNCREYFHADHATGARFNSFDGKPFETRNRAWYYDVKDGSAFRKQLKKQWSRVYVDKTTGEVAMALCEPLFNLTSSSGNGLNNSNHIEPDENGMIGVACSAMYLSDLSSLLKVQFEDFETTAVYVRERETGRVLASSGPTETYYDGADPNEPMSWISYVHAVAAPMRRTPDPMIQWSADKLMEYANESSVPTDNYSFPLDDVTILRDVEETITPPDQYANLTEPLSTLRKGNSYYITAKHFTHSGGLSWDLVTLQSLNCPTNYEAHCASTGGKCSQSNGTTWIVPLMDRCVECEDNFVSEGGNGRCNKCIKNFYMSVDAEKGTTLCEPCPPNMECDIGTTLSTIRVKEGYYRFGPDATVAFECKTKEACSGGIWNTSDYQLGDQDEERNGICNVGYTGPLCGSCTRSPTPYYHNAGDSTCKTCDSGAALLSPGVIAVIVLLVLCATATAWAFVSRAELLEYYHKREDFLQTALSQGTMLVVTCQIMVSLSDANQFRGGNGYPSPFSATINWLQVFNVDVYALFRLDCIRPSNFEDKLKWTTITPLLIAAACIGFRCVRVYLCPSGQSKVADANNSKAGNKIPFMEGWTIKFSVLFLYIIVPKISAMICETWSCEDYYYRDSVEKGQGTTISFMTSDPTIECAIKQSKQALTTEPPLALHIFAACMGVIYILGLPLCMALLLWANRTAIETRETRSGDPKLSAIGFLFRHYTPFHWHFAIIDMMRRLFLCSLIRMIRTRELGGIIALVVSSFSAIMFREVKPYFETSTDLLSYTCGWTIVFSSMSLVAMDIRILEKKYQGYLSALLIFCNVGVIVLLFALNWVSRNGEGMLDEDISPRPGDEEDDEQGGEEEAGEGHKTESELPKDSEQCSPSLGSRSGAVSTADSGARAKQRYRKLDSTGFALRGAVKSSSKVAKSEPHIKSSPEARRRRVKEKEAKRQANAEALKAKDDEIAELAEMLRRLEGGVAAPVKGPAEPAGEANSSPGAAGAGGAGGAGRTGSVVGDAGRAHNKSEAASDLMAESPSPSKRLPPLG